MNFKDLKEEEKKDLHLTLKNFATTLGSTNALLHLIEEFKSAEENPLLSKEATFSFTKGFMKCFEVVSRS